MDSVLSFVAENWVPCLFLNRDLGENVVDYYESRYGSGVEWDHVAYSCFFVPRYIGDLLRIDTDQYHLRFQNCTDAIVANLRPNRMFIFDIHNHVFTILILATKIYYIDYYSETGRPKYFRIERITQKQLQDYVQALQTLDFKSIAQFNQFTSPASLEHSYQTDVSRLMQLDPDDSIRIHFKHLLAQSYIEGVYYHEITYIPTLADILRVAYMGRDELWPDTEDNEEVQNEMMADLQYLHQRLG